MAVHQAQIHNDVASLDPDLRVCIIAAEFNNDIMSPLIEKNIATLREQWFQHIDIYRVPWCFEIPGQTREILEVWVYSLVITLWCLIRWQTPHFDYICTECSRGIMDLSMAYETPLIFGILTCNDMTQAQARVDDNFAIYGLNYLSQRSKATLVLEKKYEELKSEIPQMKELD